MVCPWRNALFYVYCAMRYVHGAMQYVHGAKRYVHCAMRYVRYVHCATRYVHCAIGYVRCAMQMQLISLAVLENTLVTIASWFTDWLINWLIGRLISHEFLSSYDLRPWLIEINSSPAMSPTSEVTAKLCTAVLEDTIKVRICYELHH